MIAILGAGISGLSIAHQLKRDGKKFILIEASSHVGGKIQTLKIENCICELGPNTVLINNKETKTVLEELNLYESLIFPEENAIKKRFVHKNSRIEQIPNSFKSALKSKLIGFKTVYCLLKEMFISKKTTSEEESLSSFCRRRLGNQIFEDFIVPFITGIYAGDPEKISINHTLSILKEAESEYGSILKGMPKISKKIKEKNAKDGLPKQKVFSFSGGLGSLTKAFENELEQNLELNARVTAIEQKSDLYQLSYSQNNKVKTIEVEKIISTLPATVLSDLIAAFSTDFSVALKQLNYVSAVSIHLMLAKNDLKFQEAAFGILSRRMENVPFLGILFNSRFFPHTCSDSEKELITVIAGGSRYPELIQKTELEIEAEITAAIQKVLGSKEKPKVLSIKKWNKGIPQYELGYDKFLETLNQFKTTQPNFYIAGNFTGGISVSDCIKNGVNLAKNC